MLAHAPVQRQFAAAHLGAIGNHFFDQGVKLEILWHGGDALGQPLELGHRQGRVGAVGPAAVEVGRPVDRVLALVVGEHRLQADARLHFGAEFVHQLIGIGRGNHPLAHQTVCIDLARARMRRDLFVHQRLGDGGGVLLVVAQFAETNNVHHHVVMELLAIVERQTGRKGHALRIVAIHMQDGRLDHFRHIGAIQRGTRIARIGGGEADLIVDDNMHRAARGVAAGLRQRQGFHHHALPRKRGIAMHQHRQHRFAERVAAPIQPRPGGAFDHRIDDFQMRRVERQAQMHRAAGRGHIAGKALVILHVTGRQVICMFALELVEQVLRPFAQGVDQHVEAAAVRHADDHFLNAQRARALNQGIHGDDKTLAAFERKALLADIFGRQIALQPFGSGQPFKQMFFRLGIDIRARAGGFQPLLPPAFLVLIAEVHELGAQ